MPGCCAFRMVLVLLICSVQNSQYTCGKFESRSEGLFLQMQTNRAKPYYKRRFWKLTRVSNLTVDSYNLRLKFDDYARNAY